MPTAADRRFTAYIVPHTHWDREWYQPFRVFQARLVDVIDTVLELLEDPAYRRFTLDGQAAVLEDYLELRPEREADLRRFVQAGRLRIGPWYVLADEFLVSPEALVRNLQFGRRVSRRFGEPLPVCYTPDSFGHVSQLPLLAAGFGLPAVVFQRGMGEDGERLGSEFLWRAADGETELFAVHLIGTYSGGTALGHVDWELTDPYDPDLALRHLRAALYGVSGDELADLPRWFAASLERVSGGLTAHANGRALVLLNGSDHLFPQPNLPQVIREADAAFPDVEFVQGDVEEYVAAARASVGPLQVYQGELRGSRYQHILAGVLSARLYLKRANHAGQTLLERYAEPLTALAWCVTGCQPRALMREAWRLLLLNHPHDSICGCSLDSVHREMLTRFEGSRQLGDDLCRRALADLGGRRPANIQDVHAAAKDAVTVFNPLPFPQRRVVRHVLELPEGAGRRLAVSDEAGTPLPFQAEVSAVYAPGRSDLKLDRVALEVLADLPPLGLANLALTQAAGSAGERVATDLGAHADHDGVITLANEHLEVTVTPAGAVTMLHVASGRRHELRLRLEDQADAGDEYDFSPLRGEAPVTFAAPTRRPTLVTAGPVTATVRLDYELEIPGRLADDRLSRVGVARIPATIDLALAAGDPALGVTVRITNAAMDHRLRLRLDSGVDTNSVWADGHFDVVERPARPAARPDWFQAPPPTNHQRRFVAVSDGAAGLAVLNRGLPEYEAEPGPNGTELAVTLVRAVGWLSRDDLLSRPQGAGPALATPEAQCLGEHLCELALYPFAGDWWQSDLLRVAQAFTAPPLAAAGGGAAAGHELVSLEGPFDLTAAKVADERETLIVRVANPAPVPAEGTLRVAWPVASAHVTRLDETRLGRAPSERAPSERAPGERAGTATSIPLRLGPKSVASFEFVLEGGDAGRASP